MALLAFVTNAGDGTVSTFRLEGDTIERIAVTPVGPGPGTLAVDPARGAVYVAVKGDPAGLLTCEVRPDGGLKQLARRDLEAPLQYLTLTRDGAWLLAASYPGGFGLVLPVGEDGVGEPTARIEYPNLHSCAVTADGRSAYFVSLGADLVAQYALHAGTLTPLDPPIAPAPAGCGPRHIVLNRAESSAYVMTEFTGQVLHYRRGPDGVLTPAGAGSAVDPAKGLAVSRFGADPKAEHLIWGADLHLAGDERNLWGSERSGSTIATLPLAEDGTISDATSFIDTLEQPRGFAVTPDGTRLLLAGERSPDVALYRVGPGAVPQLRAHVPTGAGANWVRFLEV